MSPIAATILEQMGGQHQIKAMTGARNFLDTAKGVSWAWPAKGQKPNRIEITLQRNDTYKMVFTRVDTTTWDIRNTNEYNGVYFDQLIEIFEETTGLYLSL